MGMKSNFVIFRGEHDGKQTAVTFRRNVRTFWSVIIECGGVTIHLSPTQLDKSLKPCMTHAAMLCDEHIPTQKKPARRKISIDRKLHLQGKKLWGERGEKQEPQKPVFGIVR